jgi:transposase
MKFRQSLMKYSRKYGVSRASRKYNKARSYIYFWLNRWDGTIQSLATQSKRPHHHPNEHTPEEIALIRRFRKRNPQLEVTELWHRLKKKGYTRRVESLYRVMRRLGMLPEKISAHSIRRFTLRFAELTMHKRLKEAMAHLDYTEMTEVQAQTIPYALIGRDLAVASKTGSGKTLAYLIPLMHRLLTSRALSTRGPRALILAPTRELAKLHQS